MFVQNGEDSFFLDKLRPHHKALEYGCGSSTGEIAERVYSLLSIEHQEHWFNNINKNLKSNSRLTLAKPNLPYREGGHCGTYEEFETYINAPIDYGPFDVILIDGRARVECAKICHKMATPDTLIFVHDFERAEYQVIRQILTFIDSFKTMVLFKL